MYVCVELVNDACVEWSSFSDAFGVEAGTGIAIGGMFFGLAVAAWGARLLARMIINNF